MRIDGFATTTSSCAELQLLLTTSTKKGLVERVAHRETKVRGIIIIRLEPIRIIDELVRAGERCLDLGRAVTLSWLPDSLASTRRTSPSGFCLLICGAELD